MSSPLDLLRRALPSIRANIRDISPTLAYYGTGEAAHWAVQSNQQIFGALAAIGETELALKLFRYGLYTHVSAEKVGGITCSDGKRWGCHWISELGLERASVGIDFLMPHLSEDEKRRFRTLRLCEADHTLANYPVVAAIDASTGKNKPESNVWNGSWLFRTAVDYPDAPNAAAYREKSARLLFNALTTPADFSNPLFVGANFTENFSLDHHGYMNVGYSLLTMANIALLHYWCKARNIAPPPELYHNIERAWQTFRNFVFPDGRLLRLGGDSRSRYNYCQCFALVAYRFAADFLNDSLAKTYEDGFLELIEKEQNANPDGSFYGVRLKELNDYSHFYYVRLEADPAHALSCLHAWEQKKSAACEQTARALEISGDSKKSATCEQTAISWHEPFHDSLMIRSSAAIRAVTRAGCLGQGAICVPTNRSDLAEWDRNLTGVLGLHFAKVSAHETHAELAADGKSFKYENIETICERAPMGEGEEQYDVAKKFYTAEALPDGRTMIFREKLEVIKETTFTFGLHPLHLLIPNDVYNDFSRNYERPDEQTLIIDGCLKVVSLSGETIQIIRRDRQNIFLQCGLRSLTADEICVRATDDPVRLSPGIVYDISYSVRVL